MVMADGAHARLRELLGGYLLGALGPEQDEELAGHLAGCPGCEQELVAMVDAVSGFALLDGDPEHRHP